MTGHTLRIDDDGPRNGILSECSCGTPLGFITHETVERFGLPHYAKHQAQIVRQWLHHRHQMVPRPYRPAECTIRLVGGPRDGEELTIPFHIYRDGWIVTLAAPERIRIYADEDTDMVGNLEWRRSSTTGTGRTR